MLTSWALGKKFILPFSLAQKISRSISKDLNLSMLNGDRSPNKLHHLESRSRSIMVDWVSIITLNLDLAYFADLSALA